MALTNLGHCHLLGTLWKHTWGVGRAWGNIWSKTRLQEHPPYQWFHGGRYCKIRIRVKFLNLHTPLQDSGMQVAKAVMLIISAPNQIYNYGKFTFTIQSTTAYIYYFFCVDVLKFSGLLIHGLIKSLLQRPYTTLNAFPPTFHTVCNLFEIHTLFTNQNLVFSFNYFYSITIYIK